MEYIELSDHPFFIATQAHPEFKSRMDNPSPLFAGFVESSLTYQKNQLKKIKSE
jgi:CTP synthase